MQGLLWGMKWAAQRFPNDAPSPVPYVHHDVAAVVQQASCVPTHSSTVAQDKCL